jgi:hypothetical protein
MKRSDMLLKLEAFMIELMEKGQLVDFVEINGTKTRALICDPEVKILAFLEGEGMLPPDCNKDLPLDYVEVNGVQVGSKDVIYKWDKE